MYSNSIYSPTFRLACLLLPKRACGSFDGVPLAAETPHRKALRVGYYTERERAPDYVVKLPVRKY